MDERQGNWRNALLSVRARDIRRHEPGIKEAGRRGASDSGPRVSSRLRCKHGDARPNLAEPTLRQKLWKHTVFFGAPKLAAPQQQQQQQPRTPPRAASTPSVDGVDEHLSMLRAPRRRHKHTPPRKTDASLSPLRAPPRARKAWGATRGVPPSPE